MALSVRQKRELKREIKALLKRVDELAKSSIDWKEKADKRRAERSEVQHGNS